MIVLTEFYIEKYVIISATNKFTFTFIIFVKTLYEFVIVMRDISEYTYPCLCWL